MQKEHLELEYWLDLSNEDRTSVCWVRVQTGKTTINRLSALTDADLPESRNSKSQKQTKTDWPHGTK